MDTQHALTFSNRCELTRIAAEMRDEKEDLRVELMTQFPDYEGSEVGESDAFEVVESSDSDASAPGPYGFGPIPSKAFPQQKS